MPSVTPEDKQRAVGIVAKKRIAFYKAKGKPYDELRLRAGLERRMDDDEVRAVLAQADREQRRANGFDDRVLVVYALDENGHLVAANPDKVPSKVLHRSRPTSTLAAARKDGYAVLRQSKPADGLFEREGRWIFVGRDRHDPVESAIAANFPGAHRQLSRLSSDEVDRLWSEAEEAVLERCPSLYEHAQERAAVAKPTLSDCLVSSPVFALEFAAELAGLVT